jgi:hypothetical protein
MTRECILKLTITHRPVFLIMAFAALLGSSFQQRTFSLLSVPELFPASATNSQLTVCLHTLFQSQNYVTTDSQSASLSWCQDPPGAQDQIFGTVSCGYIDVGRPPWREDRSVVYNCCWPRQRSHSQVRVPQDSWPHITASDSRLPNLEGQVPVFISVQVQGGPVIPPEVDSLFVASYDPQGYRRGIRTRLHTGIHSTDTTENTSPNSSSIVAWRIYQHVSRKKHGL